MMAQRAVSASGGKATTAFSSCFAFSCAAFAEEGPPCDIAAAAAAGAVVGTDGADGIGVKAPDVVDDVSAWMVAVSDVS